MTNDRPTVNIVTSIRDLIALIATLVVVTALG